MAAEFPIHALPSGTRLQGGKYVIEAFLGQGGFGITYRAHDPRLDRRIAVKELYLRDTCHRAWQRPPAGRAAGRFRLPRLSTVVQPPDYTVVPTGGWTMADLDQARARFVAEGRKLHALRHPGIVPVHELFSEHGTDYLVMEYVAGETLRQYVERHGGRLPVAEALRLARAAGAALTAVHAAGLVHQDVKPHNLLRRPIGEVVLIDFGAARAMTQAAGELHTVVHTEGYAAPEQYLRDGRRGAHTDVYGLAATVYYLLTGKAPAAAGARAGAELAPPRALRPEVPEGLSAGVMAGLALLAGERPQSIGGLLELLERGRKPIAPAVPVPPRREEAPCMPAVSPQAPAVRPAGAVDRNPVDGAAMVWVPAGELLMGTDRAEIDVQWKRFRWPADWKEYTTDESPMHHVRLTQGYWLYRTPVTVGQYRKYCAATGEPMPEKPGWGWQEDHPMVKVSWEEATVYCRWAGVRLPTEAEWEYAARGPEGRVFPWGDAAPAPELAVYGNGMEGPEPVGSKPAGAAWCGALGLAGNVWEWCVDWWGEKYYVSLGSVGVDPAGPAAGEYRVLRGGSWVSGPGAVRASCRHWFTPGDRSLRGGFRPARTG